MKKTYLRIEGERVEAMVGTDGLIRLWDSVAGHYTLAIPRLTLRQIQHVRRGARNTVEVAQRGDQ